MNDMEITWVDLPEDATPLGGTFDSRKGVARSFAEALKENPGAWACYGVKARGSAEHLRRSYGLEVRVRYWEGNLLKIYARWNEDER